VEPLFDLIIDTSAYHRVSFEFAALSPLAGIVLIMSVGLASWLFWHRTLPRDRVLVAVFRSAILFIVAFLILDPTLVGQKSIPGSQFVLMLFDDSKSMTIQEPDGTTRAQKLQHALSADNHRFERALSQTHQLAYYRFGANVHRIRSAEALQFSEARSDIAASVVGTLGRGTGTDVAAVVLFSDGIRQSPLPDPLDALPVNIPVFTVGTGTHQDWTSLSLTDLAVSRSPFDQSPVHVNVGVSALGLANERVILEILDRERRVVSDAFEILSDSLFQMRRLEFVPDRPGWITYRSRIRLADQPFEGISPIANERDPLPDDNVRDFVVDNRERTFRVLYFSGRPNWEHKFVRRALLEDEQIELASLIRISGAERKFVFRGSETSLSNPLFEGYDDEADSAPRYDEAVFLRIGVRQSELVTGYPLTPEDLFDYHAIIWSDVESEFFSSGHLELTRSFVSDRGGSLLLLGGPRSLAEGGYGGSVIEPLLPVVLPSSDDHLSQDWSRSFYPNPTMAGVLSGIWSLDPDPDKNRGIWETLPRLYGTNTVLTTRAGADVLARAQFGTADSGPLFALQRYGEGSCAVFATGETWPMTMLTDNPDPSHGRFWRQMIRSLLANVPDPVVFPNIDDAVVGEPLELSTLLRDSTFIERESLNVNAHLVGPKGETISLGVEESIEQSGRYSMPFTPTRPGTYRLEIDALDTDGTRIARDDHAFIVHPDTREHLNPRYAPNYLRKISAQTGGRFFELADLESLPDHIPWEQTSADQIDRIPLWNAPPFYVILVILLVTEWYLRRKRGHP
jgi:uncharacterized membrane protein